VTNSSVGPGRGWSHWRLRLGSMVGVIALAAFLPAAAGAATGAPHAAVSPKVARGTAVKLTRVGVVNLGALSKAAAARSRAATRAGTPHVEPLGIPSFAKRSAANVTRLRTFSPRAALRTKSAGNVAGEVGFDGMGAGTNESVFGFDVTPPDQGLGVGTSSAGTAIVESLNLTIQAFTPSGAPLTVPIGANAFMGLGPCTGTGFPTNCPSDPRVYWDPQTKHWFLTDFTFTVSPPAEQLIAVSQTTNALGNYTIFSIPTVNSIIAPSDCPCFGDFDMIGADNSGFYITTNEFSNVSGAFHGTNLYAISKTLLIAAARGGAVPPIFQYTVPTTSDPFGAYHLAPSSVTQGSAAPNDEYFVESDANTLSNSALEVWALTGTRSLNSSIPPPLVNASVATEGYSVPPNATQKSGPIPLGNTVGALVPSPLQTDFNAVQQVTYAGGRIYAQLDTGVNAGGGATKAGAAWFALRPKPGTSSLSVSNNGNGYVAVNGHILYPSIGVNANGNGYMGFAISGGSNFPTAAYIKFHNTAGAVGPIFTAKAGTVPLDDFSCYPGAGFGPACRYGDYSMTQNFNGRIYLATEYVHSLTNVTGGGQSNFLTRIWSVPSGS
jgi:hypothetical protein